MLTRIQVHVFALVGFISAALALLEWRSPASLGPAPALTALGFPLVAVGVGALLGIGEWIGQIGTVQALSAIKRGEIPADQDEG